MTDYTPTTKQVKEQFTREEPPRIGTVTEKGRAFDRWLEQIRAEAWNEGHYASDTAWTHAYDGHPVPEGEFCPECCAGNPYKETQA